MKRSKGGLIAVLAAVGMAATGLVAGSTGTANAKAASVANVHITKAHDVSMARHLRPGLHKFHVTSRAPAAFQLVRAKRGYSAKEAVHDVNQGLGAGNVKWLRRFERNTMLLGGVSSSPGSPGTMWARIPRGSYWAVDTNARPLTVGELFKGTTRGHTLAGRPPGDKTVAAIKDASWAAHPSSIAPKGVLKFANRSHDNHFLELAKLADGKTLADFKAWVDKAKSGADPGNPPLDPSAVLDTGVVSPGHSMSQSYKLPEGDYVLSCWWPDADMGGMPHAFMGMYREIHVAAPTH